MKIEKDVPIPQSIQDRLKVYGTKAKNKQMSEINFIDEMNVGDSVFFQGGKAHSSFYPYAAAKRFAENRGIELAGRTVDGGVRIWRVA